MLSADTQNACLPILLVHVRDTTKHRTWQTIANSFLTFFHADCSLRTMFLSKSDAVKSVWQAFENYVTV